MPKSMGQLDPAKSQFEVALVEKVDSKLRYVAKLPSVIFGLLGKYCEYLGDPAAAPSR